MVEELKKEKEQLDVRVSTRLLRETEELSLGEKNDDSKLVFTARRKYETIRDENSARKNKELISPTSQNDESSPFLSTKVVGAVRPSPGKRDISKLEAIDWEGKEKINQT